VPFPVAEEFRDHCRVTSSATGRRVVEHRCTWISIRIHPGCAGVAGRDSDIP
jgi:hypothetical protein